jgi:cytoskeletal protein RodZ
MLGRFATPPTESSVTLKGFDDFDVRLGDVMRGERATLGKSLQDIERDLRIKTAYLAAIENGDLSAFEAPSFIAGYVRSYARYLGLNPEDSFMQFCRETGFVPAHGLSPAASTPAVVAVRAKSATTGGSVFNPAGLGQPQSSMGWLEPGALGQMAVLLAVIGGLAYGGWSLLREVQMVQLAPIDQAPTIVADAPAALGATLSESVASLDPVAQAGPALAAPQLPRSSDETAARIAQPEALDVPILIARDGPISAIDPRDTSIVPKEVAREQVQVVAAPELVEVLAVRPSWISVTAADGTVLFEKILDAGERYAVPALEVAPLLKAGNSSAIYFVMGDKTYGPASRGPEVVRDVDLSVQGIKSVYSLADPSLDGDLTAFVAENDAAISPMPSAALPTVPTTE